MLALAVQPAKKIKYQGKDCLEVVAGSLMPAHSNRGISLFAKDRGYVVKANDRGYSVVRGTGWFKGWPLRTRTLPNGVKASPLTNLQRGLVSLT